jgi:hypothetical protein
LPEADVTSEPKVAVVLRPLHRVERRRRELLRGDSPDRVVNARRAGEERRTDLSQRAPAHFGKADMQKHLIGRHRRDLQQRDHFFALVGESRGHVDDAVDRFLARHIAGQDDVFSRAVRGDRFARKERRELLGQSRDVALHDQVVATERALPIPDVHRDRTRRFAVHQ